MVIFQEIIGEESVYLAKRRENLTRKLMKLTQKNSYEIIQTNGQRVYAPPASMTILPPPKGCEIFIGKLPKNVYEDTLIPIFEKIGPLYKFRLMLDFEERTRGYAFATYFTPQKALEAVMQLHNYEIRENMFMGVYKSVDNCRLFVGNIPIEKNRMEIIEELKKYMNGIVEVILYQQINEPALNRGFVFLEFESHRAAAMVRRQFTPQNLVAWGQPLYVDWADPLPEVDPNVMAKVNVLYLRNVPLDFSSDEVFTAVCNRVGTQIVKKVHKMHNYAFVHFIDRRSAEYGLEKLRHFGMGGQLVDIEWARPQCYSKKNVNFRTPENFCTSVPPYTRRLVKERIAELNGSRSSSNGSRQDHHSSTQGSITEEFPSPQRDQVSQTEENLAISLPPPSISPWNTGSLRSVSAPDVRSSMELQYQPRAPVFMGHRYSLNAPVLPQQFVSTYRYFSGPTLFY